MAELVGTVSGIAGIVSLAVQVGENLVKLKNFCEEVRNAPKGLLELLHYAKVLDMVLNNVPLSTEGPVIQSCVQLCEHAAEELRALISKLDAAMSSAKKGGLKMMLAKIKFVLQKDALKKLKSLIDSAIQLLQLACLSDYE